MNWKLIVFLAAGIWIFGFLVGRNNPSIAAVNRLIGAGKAIWDDGAKLLKKVTGGKL